MNEYIAVAYQLFVKGRDDAEERLIEQRTEDQPFVFITNLKTVLPQFEYNVVQFRQSDKIEFYIKPEEAYGEYHKELVVQLPLDTCLNEEGKLDERFFFVGNIIPLNNAQGETFNATIIDISDEAVTVDLNHPRAGISMHFIGEILIRREATQEEVDDAIAASRSGCGGCGGCSGGCESGCSGGCESGCGGCGQC